MQIDRRFTNGLAWAGAFIVVGVPLADIVSAQLFEPATERVATVGAPATPVAPIPRPASERPEAPATQVAAAPVPKEPVPSSVDEAPVDVAAAEPVKTGAQTPAATATLADPVANYMEGGRTLPSYISDGGDAAPAAIAATGGPSASTSDAPHADEDPITVAALPEKAAVPFPMPLSMRPTPKTAPTFGVAPSAAAPVVIPETVVAPANITAAELADWESGPLSEFLARRQQQGAPSAYFGGSGYLDAQPAPRGDRVVGPAAGFYAFPFAD